MVPLRPNLVVEPSLNLKISFVNPGIRNEKFESNLNLVFVNNSNESRRSIVATL